MQAPTSEHFRAALGRFATGVTIVTARAPDGTPVGLTVNSFNSVSLEPPLVLWSLSNTAQSMPVFQQCSHYAIHVLSVQQRDLALRFATREVDRWVGVEYSEAASGAPILPGAVAVFECANRSRYEAGDHVIYVGEVQRCEYSSTIRPLLYHGGRFYTEHPL